MTPSLSTFDLDAITLSGLRQRRSAKWRTYGPEVLPAFVAEMDYPLAPAVAQELHAAIERSDTGYRDKGRLPEAMVGFWDRRWGVALDPTRVHLVPDVMSGIAQALLAFTEPNSAVVITSPVYPPFFATPRHVNRRVVDVPLINLDTSSSWDLDGLAMAFARPDVSAFLMSNPHNPTGTVATRQTLAAIGELAAVHGVCVIVDEIHAPLVLPGAEHIPYLSVVDDDANAVIVTSASKAWNIAGLKCAQVIGTQRTSDGLAKMPMEVAFGVGHLGVLGSVAAYDHGDAWLDDVIAVLDFNRELLGSLLSRCLASAAWVPPEATYLAWIDLRECGLGDDPAVAILERGKVALSAGPTFGGSGRGFARLNFATSPAIVADIVAGMASVLQ